MKEFQYIKHIDVAAVYGGEVQRTLLFTTLDTDNQHVVRLAYATIHPNCGGQPHFHPLTEERYYILEGEGKLEISNQSLSLQSGICVFIPPKTKHCLRCTGEQPLKYIAFHVADSSFRGDVKHLSDNMNS